MHTQPNEEPNYAGDLKEDCAAANSLHDQLKQIATDAAFLSNLDSYARRMLDRGDGKSADAEKSVACGGHYERHARCEPWR